MKNLVVKLIYLKLKKKKKKKSSNLNDENQILFAEDQGCYVFAIDKIYQKILEKKAEKQSSDC